MGQWESLGGRGGGQHSKSLYDINHKDHFAFALCLCASDLKRLEVILPFFKQFANDKKYPYTFCKCWKKWEGKSKLSIEKQLTFAYQQQQPKIPLKIAVINKNNLAPAILPARLRFLALIVDIASKSYVSRRHGRELGKPTLLAWVIPLQWNTIKGEQTHLRLH